MLRAKARIPCICSPRKASRLVPRDRLVLGVQFVRGGGPQDALDQYRMMKEMKEHPQKGARFSALSTLRPYSRSVILRARALGLLSEGRFERSFLLASLAMRRFFHLEGRRQDVVLSRPKGCALCATGQLGRYPESWPSQVV